MAIAGRELRAYFCTPSGYIVIALFLLMTGALFSLAAFDEGQLASLRLVFGGGTWLLAFVAPAITMRLISEEYKMGTYETLLTAPVREREVVLGKFLGGLGLLSLMLLPTLLYLPALEWHGRPDYGEVLCGFLGLLLAGSAYLASGILASTLTSSQPVAFLLALFFWLTLGLGTKLLPPHLGERMSAMVYAADPQARLADFSIGLFDTANVIYFLAITAVFLLASTVSLEWRRMR